MIKFFSSESLYDKVAKEQAESLIGKFENDNRVLKYQTFFFYKEDDQNSLVKDYPVIVELYTKDVETFIGWEYEQGEDLVFNGLHISEEYMREQVEVYTTYSDEFEDSFWNNPELTINEVKKQIESWCVSTVLAGLIKEIKEADIEILEDVVKDFSSL